MFKPTVKHSENVAKYFLEKVYFFLKKADNEKAC